MLTTKDKLRLKKLGFKKKKWRKVNSFKWIKNKEIEIYFQEWAKVDPKDEELPHGYDLMYSPTNEELWDRGYRSKSESDLIFYLERGLLETLINKVKKYKKEHPVTNLELLKTKRRKKIKRKLLKQEIKKG